MINLQDPDVRADLREKLAQDIAYFREAQGSAYLDYRPAGIALSWFAAFDELLRAFEYVNHQAQGMMHSFGSQVAGGVALQAENDQLQHKLKEATEEIQRLNARARGLN